MHPILQAVRRLAVVVAVALLMPGLFALPLPASAQTAPPPSSEEILNALRAKSKTRGLSVPADPAKASAERAVIDNIKAKATRGLSVQERKELASVTRTRPSVDLEIYFNFDSADITPQAMPTLISLGEALRSSDLQGVTFLVGGHTDGQGSATYNQTLSERRAQAVRKFLAERFNISQAQLLAVGYGKEQLKNAGKPLADENRRVQVVNLGK